MGLAEVQQVLGWSRGFTYARAREGEILPGCPCWRIGHKFVVPRRRFEVALGLVDETPDSDG